MALAQRYTAQFKSVKNAEVFDVILYQESFTGYARTLAYLPSRNFLKLSYDKTNANLLWPVRGSQLSIVLSLEPSEIEDFIFADNRTWFIEVIGSSGFFWQGWYQGQPSVNYNPYGLRDLELQFSDNLGALQNTPDNVMASLFVEKQSFRTMIERLLGYTDIVMPIVIATSITHFDHPYDTVEDIAFLEQVMTLDYNGQEPQSAYDILSKILRMMQCVVYQKNGNWVIENLIDKYQAATPVDLLTQFNVAARVLNIRLEAPLSKVRGKSYHYQIRHTQQNRDFSDYIPSGPNKGFVSWEQFGLLGNEIFSLLTVSGKNFFQVRGNYVSTVTDSNDYYMNDGGTATEGEAVRLYFNYEYTPGLGFDVNARIAIILDAGGTPWYLGANGLWSNTATPIIITGDLDIADVLNIATIAPITGNISIRVYRPEVPSLPSTYNPTVTYMRVAFADIIASKVSNPEDYKLFKSVATKANKGLRETEYFETIGLQFDTEFSPNGAAFFQFQDFVSFVYDSAGQRLDSRFTSGYEATEWSLTQFATNTYARLFAKPQVYVEADLYGKNLNVGDIYTLNIPGFASAITLVVVAFDYDLKNDVYSAVLAYIEYDSANTITNERFWLQQLQNDPEGN
jgi:hypothetical protein